MKSPPRVALDATPSHVIGLVVRDGVMLAAIGLGFAGVERSQTRTDACAPHRVMSLRGPVLQLEPTPLIGA
jgi:hypothetical protein